MCKCVCICVCLCACGCACALTRTFVHTCVHEFVCRLDPVSLRLRNSPDSPSSTLALDRPLTSLNAAISAICEPDALGNFDMPGNRPCFGCTGVAHKHFKIRRDSIHIAFCA